MFSVNFFCPDRGLEDFFFANFPEGFSSHFYSCREILLDFLLNRFSSNGFSAYAAR